MPCRDIILPLDDNFHLFTVGVLCGPRNPTGFAAPLLQIIKHIAKVNGISIFDSMFTPMSKHYGRASSSLLRGPTRSARLSSRVS